jgi:hypothetical protein
MFHMEVNHEYPELCAEMSFIQRSWGEWDQKKKLFRPF